MDDSAASKPHTCPPLSTNDVQRPNASGVTSDAAGNGTMGQLGVRFHTPPRQLRILPGTAAGSGISSMTTSSRSATSNDIAAIITASASASTSPANATTPQAGRKRQASSSALDDDSSSPLSPSKQYPDYSVTKSSGKSVASADDSVQWEAEGE